jgi:glutamate 5-kinase
MTLNWKHKKRIVIKIGSSLLVKKGKLRKKWLKSFAEDVAALIEKDFQIVIVSSGVVALGCGILKIAKDKFPTGKIPFEERQVAAAIGQTQLMSFYHDFFKKFNLNVAQLLLTAPDCNIRNRYLNSKNTIENLLKKRIIPVINENDTIAVDEIKIGDNDRLAARLAQMVSADMLILFSDIDGLYNKNPKTQKNAHFISEVEIITGKIENMAGKTVSGIGTGGMITKIMAAKMLKDSGCETIIANGIPDNALKKLMEGKQNFTIFHSKKGSARQRKKWLSGFLNVKGEVIINGRAVETLRSKKVSLLPVGAVGVEGQFAKGDAILIKDEKGNHIASGISNYSFLDLKKVLEKNSAEVKKILGKSVKAELIHIDNLVLI